MITISTSQFNKIINAEIDGHIYGVRKIGAGEQLDISQLGREMASLQVEALNTRAKIEKATSDDAKKKQTENLVEVMNKMTENVAKMEKIYSHLFDDGEDGSRSLELVHSVGIENVQKIIDQVFAEGENGD